MWPSTVAASSGSVLRPVNVSPATGASSADASGALVTPLGYKVLNTGGTAITIPEGEVNIAADGTISVDGTTVTQLGINSYLTPRTELIRSDDNLYQAKGTATGTDKGRVVQAYLESSNGNASQLMTQLVEVTRSYEAAQQLVANNDELLGKSISTLGRIG